MDKYRVFTKHLGWAECMYIFKIDTKYSVIKKHPRTRIISKNDYIGTYEFDEKILGFFEKIKNGNDDFYIKLSYDELVEK